MTKNNDIIYIEIPTICPVCGGATQIIKENNSEVLMCTNPACDGKLLGQLVHAVSKKALNVDGLSEQTLSWLIIQGWVKNIKDIYHIYTHRNSWVNFSSYGNKSVDKILEAIEKSRYIDLAHFICALNIPNVGSSASKAIALLCGTWEDFFSKLINGYDFTSLPDFGDTTNKAIYKWSTFHLMEANELSKEMHFSKVEKIVVTENQMFGKKFCITGSFSQNRTDLQKRIESLGAIFVSGVSKNLDVLFVGTNAGSKLTKAQSLGIRTAGEAELMKILGE